jgi:CheY-like chemotaxis protein
MSSTTGPDPAALSLSGVRVLVVDDDLHSREAVTSVLEHYGATVTAVGSGAAALEAVSIESPDVMVADLVMPGMDGFELIRRVRALPPEAGGGTPAAALSAHAASDEGSRILGAGYQYHLTKPLEVDRLLAVVAILAARE